MKLLVDNTLVFKFLDFRRLRSSDATGIVQAVSNCLDEYSSNWKTKLVAFGADSAPVNLDIQNGAAVQLKADVPHLIAIHGCAHRLELAIRDSLKHCNLMSLADDVMENVYKMYHKSPLCWRGLQETGLALGLPVVKPIKLKGTRLIDYRKRALDVVLRIWPALAEHTSQVRLGRTAMRGRAVKLNSMILRLDVLMFMYLLQDPLVILARLSTALQKNTATIDSVLRSIKATKTELHKIGRQESSKKRIEKALSRVERDSPLEKPTVTTSSSSSDESETECAQTYSGDSDDPDAIPDDVNIDTKEGAPVHRGVHLKRPQKSIEQTCQAVQSHLSRVCNAVIGQVNERFASFAADRILSSLPVFSPQLWPDDSDDIDFGDEQIVFLSEHCNSSRETRIESFSLFV